VSISEKLEIDFPLCLRSKFLMIMNIETSYALLYHFRLLYKQGS